MKSQALQKTTVPGVKLVPKILENVDVNYHGPLRAIFKQVPEFTEAGVVEYFKYLQRTGKKAKTISFYKTALFKYLEAFYSGDTLATARLEALKKSVKVPKVQRGLRADKIISAAELAAMLEGAAPKQRVIVEILASTGLRETEAATIRKDQIKRGTKHITLTVIGKGNKEREVFISPDLLKRTLQAYRGRGEYLLPVKPVSIRQAIYRLSERTIGRKVCPHALRHYFCTSCVKQGIPVKAAALYVGHSGTSVFNDYYVDVSLEPRDALEVLRASMK